MKTVRFYWDIELNDENASDEDVIKKAKEIIGYDEDKTIFIDMLDYEILNK